VSDYGLKVSNVGDDAKTASDKDLRFTSKYSTLKLYQAGTLGFTSNASGNGTATLAHNLGFAPAFFGFRKGTASNSFLDSGTSYPNAYFPSPGFKNYWISNQDKIHTYTDASNLYVQSKNAGSVTNYNFKYYTLVDLTNDYSGTQANITTNDYGFKVSKAGVDVKTAKEYELGYSSKYKALQYYPESLATISLSLPAATADYFSDVEGGQYVDFNHGLGYPPFFLAYYKNVSNNYVLEVPDSDEWTSQATTNYELVSSWCDATRVRVSWWKKSYWSGTEALNILGGTIEVKLIVFTEDLSKNEL
jgi:hypothetical protein